MESSVRSLNDPKVIILLSVEDRKEYTMQQAKHKVAVRKDGETTLRSMFIKNQHLFERIYGAFDLKEDIVRNVMAYAKCLPKPGTDVIDKNIFDAQMKRFFKLTNITLLERMYQVCCSEYRSCIVKVDEFIELICVFLTGLRDLQVQFVFRVYNSRGDGFLNRRDIEYFIKPMVENMADDDEEASANAMREITDMLIYVCDKNGDGSVELDEFRELVDQNVLMMTCLGPCLPNEDDIIAFREMIQDKTSLECSAFFRYERRISLCEPKLVELKGIQRFYPVELELP